VDLSKCKDNVNKEWSCRLSKENAYVLHYHWSNPNCIYNAIVSNESHVKSIALAW